jgi:hypothetical protein
VAEISRTSTFSGLARDRLDLALLDGAQELDLGRRRHLADLVEDKRAAGRLNELCRCAVGSRR